jgi:hypothetical protein
MRCVASCNQQMSQCQKNWGELDNHVGVVVIVIKRRFPSYIGGQTSMRPIVHFPLFTTCPW